MKDIHPIQKNILIELMITDKLSFKDLDKLNVTSDLLSYHLKQLIDQNIIVKSDKHEYSLTKYGDEFVALLDFKLKNLEQQPIQVVMAICSRIIKGKKQFLIHKRCKHPDFGFYSLPEGKVRAGYSLKQNVLRELEEETGLKGEATLKEIKHLIKVGDGKIVKDVIIYVYNITQIIGLVINSPEGENFWMTIEEYKKLENTYTTNLESILNSQKKSMIVYEKILYTK